jgi:CRISPR/Cas system type I-B associated protein Csh2 (Cas7 group RAMP superfamily)
LNFAGLKARQCNFLSDSGAWPIKAILLKLLENDAASARSEGSMAVKR